MSALAVDLEGVVLVRGGRRILDVEHLAIRGGEFLGVVGRNGAGKTTLLHVLAGLVRPTRGVVRHDGAAITHRAGWSRTSLRRRIGFVPQATEYNAELPLTVRDVVEMGCAGPTGLFRRPAESDKQSVWTWLDRLGLAGMADRTFRSLSGGEQQKVLLARAMVQHPGLLLLDEPGANLDLDWKERLVAALEQICLDRPITVVMVSHETGLLPRCCDRVALMDRGRIVCQGPPQDVLLPEALARFYGCAVRMVETGGRRHVVGAASGQDMGLGSGVSGIGLQNERA